MSKRTKLQLILVLLLSVALLIGCAPGDDPGKTEAPPETKPADPGTDTPETEGPSADVEVVKIGAILPLTGGDALDGQNQRNAHDLAVQHINEQGGIKSLGGARVEIIYGDTTGAPEVGNAETERLITEEGVLGVMGAFHGGVTVSAAGIAERYEVPFLCPNALVYAITQQGYDYTFKTVPDSTDYSRDSVQLVLDLNEAFDTDAKTAGLIVADNLVGQQMLEGWTDWIPKLGMEEVERQIFPPTATNLQSEILRLKEADPDVILSQANAKEVILIVNTMKELNYWPKFGIIGAGGGWSNPVVWEDLGDSAESLFLVNDWYPYSAREGSLEINEAFRAQYFADMTGNANSTYLGTWVLKEAIEQAASRDPKVIAETLRTGTFSHPNINFMYDQVSFDEKGLNEYAVNVAAQVQEGKPIVVWPESDAYGEARWPVPHWDER